MAVFESRGYFWHPLDTGLFRDVGFAMGLIYHNKASLAEISWEQQPSSATCCIDLAKHAKLRAVPSSYFYDGPSYDEPAGQGCLERKQNRPWKRFQAPLSL